MSPRAKSDRWNQSGETPMPTPSRRLDGELYPRPEPSPFTAAWAEGYEDGFEGRPRRFDGIKLDELRYDDGYEAGTADREEVSRAGSSNT